MRSSRSVTRPSKAPYGTPELFQKKKDRLLHLCVDYRALNKEGYYQVCVEEGERAKYNAHDLRCIIRGKHIGREGGQFEESLPSRMGELALCLAGEVRVLPARGVLVRPCYQPGQTTMDEAKSHAIQEFINGYSAKDTVLTKVLKKNKSWVWSEDCQREFECLKAAVTKELVLTLPDISNSFKIHTDASEFAI
uniref:Reverse transcriptase/retrotransposon-derived protein RNase H-like domain-containing protein n=1 Tax=Solanum lycopersicum TaxID=4081 RepID=A0A3Q7IG47_SOLLC